MIPQPRLTDGWAVSYSPGIMEATAAFMGFDLTEYKDGVALMSCADVGHTVWIRRREEWPDKFYEWDGPFLVVDCAEWDDHYAIAMYFGEVIEVGFKTAERWGWVTRDWQGLHYTQYLEWVDVWKGITPPAIAENAITYHEWFRDVVEFQPEWRGWTDRKPLFRPPHVWLIDGQWINFVAQEQAEWRRIDRLKVRLYIWAYRNFMFVP